MKKILILFILGLFITTAHSQVPIYNIKGESIPTHTGDTMMFIYYNTECCHLCVYDAIEYCKKWMKKGSNRKGYFLLDGKDILSMRYQTDCLAEYLDSSTGIVTTYDLNPDKNQRFEAKVKLSSLYAPQIFVVYPNKTKIKKIPQRAYM